MSDAFDVRLKSNGNYWQAYWVNTKGEPCSKGLGSKKKVSERQARAKCRHLGVDLRLGVQRDGKAPRLSEWLDKYLLLRTDLDAKTRHQVGHTGRYLKAYFTNDPPIDRITRLDAADWRAALARGELRKAANLYPKRADQIGQATKFNRKRKGERPSKPLSEATVAKHVRDAKRIFEEATEENGLGLIDKNPFRKLSGRAPKPSKTWAVITQEQLLLVLAVCPNDGWKALFALCRLAGLRRGEALDLQWQDVVWGQNKIIVNARLAKETTKKAKRVCPIEPGRCPTGLAKILRDVFSAAPDGSTHVCAGVRTDDIDRDAKRIIQSSGIPAYAKPFHALRKNREGEVAAHYPQHVFTEWMGHDGEVAEQFYLRVEATMFEPPPEPELAQKRAQSGRTSKATNA
jgi:integrase